MKPTVVLLYGPTASGKSALALSLCRALGGEIVSADSMQLYRGLDLGTAKPTAKERRQVFHHCIDLFSPDHKATVAEYRAYALEAIADCTSRGVLPIVCGGTGLYFDSLLYENTYGESKEDPAYRALLIQKAETEGSDSLYRELCAIDPSAAERIHPNDLRRIVRALEIAHTTSKTPSEVCARRENTDFVFYKLYLDCTDRALLYRTCDERVDSMLARGLLDEVKALVSAGLSEAPTAAQAIGYKELFAYLAGNADFEQAVSEIKRRTRNYAKRQITWFSRYDHNLKLTAYQEENALSAITALREFQKGEKTC